MPAARPGGGQARYCFVMRRERGLRWALVALLLLGALQPVTRSATDPVWLVDLALDLDSPDALATYMLRRFSFRHDRDLYGAPERFATPAEFAARGAGDCDDWAWFAAAVLRRQGYPTWLLSVWRSTPDEAGNTGHMVAAYLTAEGWGYVSTEGHVFAGDASIPALAERVSPTWSGASIWTYAGTPRRPVPWNGWQPSVWVGPPRHQAPDPLFAAATRFRLRFEGRRLEPAA